MSSIYPTESDVRFHINRESIPTLSIVLLKENYGWPIYMVRATPDDGGVMIKAGCRWFTLSEAIKHWGKPSAQLCKTPRGCITCEDIRKRYRAMTRLLPQVRERAVKLGWAVGVVTPPRSKKKRPVKKTAKKTAKKVAKKKTRRR